MASRQDVTFEQLMRMADEIDLDAVESTIAQRARAGAAVAAPRDVIAQICAIWKIIRPIILTVANLPFVPPKIQQAIRAFASLLDALCSSV